MKTILATIALLFNINLVIAQDFSFDLVFTDNLGNTDTLTLGYDSLATDSIDTLFGEQNILNQPFNDTFEVRLSNRLYSFPNFFEGDSIEFYTKKQIAYNYCEYAPSNAGSIMQVNIKSKNWPVSISRNPSIFNTVCRSYSFLTSVHPGGWWDTGGDTYFMSDSSPTTINKSQYYYIENTDTLYAYWFLFADHRVFEVSVNEISTGQNEIKAFPNPANTAVSLQLPAKFGQFNSGLIYNTTGQQVLSFNSVSNIDITHFKPGLYFMVIYNQNGVKYTARFVKE